MVMIADTEMVAAFIAQQYSANYLVTLQSPPLVLFRFVEWFFFPYVLSYKAGVHIQRRRGYAFS